VWKNRRLPLFLVLVFAVFGGALVAVRCFETVWVGRRSANLKVRVIDAGSGTPVAGASVCIWRRHEDGKPCRRSTNQMGTVVIERNLIVVGRRGLLRDRSAVSFAVERISIHAPGYVRYEGMLADHIGLTSAPQELRDLTVDIAIERVGGGRKTGGDITD